MSHQSEDIFIFSNDFTDSDNWAAGKALMRAAQKSLSTKVIWIIEARQVLFGGYATSEQQNEWVNILEKVFPKQGRKKLLNGLGADEIKTLKKKGIDISQLTLAKRPKPGPKEDALLHGRLMARSFAIYLAEQSHSDVHVFFDAEGLNSSETPVNLNVHDHEELVNLLEAELEDFREIMARPPTNRAEDLRKWYKTVIERHERIAEDVGATISDLDINSLCDAINSARSVRFFGGSSASLLKRLAQRGVASKMQCYMQLGAMKLERNLFPNQFNVQLNIDAARYVFAHSEEFKHFAVIPSDSTLNVKYPLEVLGEGDDLLKKRFLAFNCRVDIMKVGANATTDGLSEIATVPDLTALLCLFSSNFAGATWRSAILDDTNDKLTLREVSQETGIQICKIEPKEFEAAEIKEIFSELRLDSC